MIVSILVEPPTSKSLSSARVVWLVPSIICLSVLSYAGTAITLESDISTETIIGYNTTNTNQIILNSTTTLTTSPQYTLIEPVWVTIHYLLVIVMIVYVLIQILQLLTKTD